MLTNITLEKLRKVVAEDAAIRRVQRLQPVGGPGDKIFPPTYPVERGPTHVFETRRIDGKDVRCALLDSVQSQANRLEEALSRAMNGGRIKLPHIAVDFTGKKTKLRIKKNGHGAEVIFGEGQEYDLSNIGNNGKLTSLDVPHRVFDAIIRDSEYDHPSNLAGKRFGDESTPIFANLIKAKPQYALPIFEVSPTALLFGAWHSTGKGGGLGAKFARCLVSEIVGVGARPGRKVSSRIDPLEIQDVPIYEDKADPTLWTANPAEAKIEKEKPKLYPAPQGKKAGRPSLVNHSNVTPSVTEIQHAYIGESAGFEFFRDRDRKIELVARYPAAQFDDLNTSGGVTIDYAAQTSVLSCAGLRRLKFAGVKDEVAGHLVLAALALVALTEQDEACYPLRSRCDLVCEGKAPFQIVHSCGSIEEFHINSDAAVKLFNEAVAVAKAAGFPWKEEPIKLVPQRRLIELVALSRAKALSGESEDDKAQPNVRS